MNPLCKYCGKPIVNADCKQKYCIPCALTVKRSKNAARSKQYRDAERTQKPLKFCQMCGKDITETRQRKYCVECAKNALNKSNIASHNKYMDRLNNENAQALALIQKPKKPKKPPTLTANEVTRRANALGLSYGQYSVQAGLYDNIYKGGLHI